MAARLTLLEVERTRQPQAPAMVDNKKFNGWLVYTANQKNHGRDDVNSLGANVPKLFGNALATDLLHSISSSSIPSAVRDSDGMALNLDGADDFIYTKNRIDMKGINKDQTFLIVVKFTSTPSDVALIGHFSSDFNMTDYGRGIGISGGTIHAFGCNGSNGQIINSGITPVVGALYCIAARCSTNGGLFINGVKYGATSLNMAWEYAFAIGATGGLAADSGVGGRRLTGKVYLAAAADFSHTDNYLQAITNNPWQIFEPEEIPLFKPVVTAQYARPVADVSSGGWTASTGSDLYAMLDEAAADDGDYITTTSASTCEVAIGSLTDPASSTGHIVRYRISATGGGIIVRLREGSTTIASWTHNPAPASLTTYEQTLSGGEADSITSYSALSLQFEAM